MKKVLCALLIAVSVQAQLPVARLSMVFPPGAQIGAPTVVKVDGSDLDDVREMRFSHPGISATFKSEGHFTVTATNVPPGIYEARVVGRFGASSPRPFVIGDRPEFANAASNKSIATAQETPVGSVIFGKAAANAPDFFKFKAQKGQRLIIECLGTKIDSRLEPVLVVFDAAARELDRTRSGGLLDFTAAGEGEYFLKLHDSQFRGGDEYWYRLALRNGPWLDFALPAAIEKGARAKITLFGRNLPEGKASEFKLDGRALDQLEVEIEAPSETFPSLLARRPADAATDGFEWRLKSAHGDSNPILIGLATGKPVLETGPNDRATNAMAVAAPCEIQGQFFPRGDADWFQFEAAKGDVYWIEIFSQRLGLATDPFLLVQRVARNDKGEEQISEAQEIYDIDTNAGGPEFNTATRDGAARVEVKEAGSYRVQARDLFSENISDPRRVYRLSIRRESPDFRLIAYPPAPPPLNKDSKEVSSWGAFLRRGDSAPLRVLALRRDNFTGDIELSAANLPPGVSAAPAKIKSGSNEGAVILTASENAAAWTGPVLITGKARIGEKEIIHSARAGTIAWNVGDYNNEAVQSRLAQELLLHVSGGELAPLAIGPAGNLVEAAAGSKVTVPIAISRRNEFNGALKFKAFMDPPKEFEVDGKATNATFEIDLNQAKLAPGVHWFLVYATSPGRYRRITTDEAKSMEAEIKKLKDDLAAITEASKKDPINNQIKALESRLAYKDLTATFYGTVGVSVTAPPPKAP